MKKIFSFVVGVVTAFVMVAVGPYVMKEFFDTSENQAKAFYSFIKNTGCFENYTNWNNSLNRKNDPDWNLYYVPVGVKNGNNGSDPYKMVEQYLDVNGDSLNDYIFYGDDYANGGNNTPRYECVYLNSGRGWQKAYACVKATNGVVNGVEQFKYYGDCAG